MRKYLCLIIIFFSLCTKIHSQSVEYIKADSVYNEGDFKYALEAFKNIAASALNQRTSKDKDLYIKSSVKAAYCCHNLGMGKEGLKICSSLIDMHTDEQYRKQINEVYCLCGLDCVYDMLMSDKTDLNEVRTLLDRIKPYSEGELFETVLKRLQYTYIIEGYDYLNRLEYKKAYESLSKGRYISNNDLQCIMLAYGMAEAQEKIGTYEQILSEYDNVCNMAKNTGNEKYHYRALKAQCGVSRQFNDMERYAMYGAKLDSLINVTSDRNILQEYYQFIGTEFTNIGDYAMAESYYKRFKENADKEEDDVSRSFLSSIYYNRMRDLKRSEGKYKEALKYQNLLLRWYESKYTSDNYLRYTIYFMETQLYTDLKDSINFERSCDTLLRSIDVMPNSYLRSLVYNFRGSGYSSFGNSAKAIHNFTKADSILAEDYPETFELRINLLQLRASEYKRLNNLSEAYSLYKKFVDLTQQVFGEESVQYSDALMKLADVKRLQGDMNESALLYTRSISIMNEILRTQLRYIPSTSRKSYIKNFTERLWAMMPVADEYRNINKQFVKLCYDTLLNLKSLIFESDRSMYNTLKTDGTKEDVDDFVTMMVLRSKLKSLYKDYDNNKKEIDAKTNSLHELDNKLTLKSKVYKDYTSFLDYRYEDVCAQLGSDDVLFDFFEYKTEEGSHNYVVYIVKKEYPTPVILNLFSQDRMDDVIGEGTTDYIYCREKSAQILDMLWSRLEQYAVLGSDVYYVPSGDIHNIAIESLPLSDGSLLGEHYNFVRLTSAREIENSRRGLSGKKDAVLYGGLLYDVDIADMEAESKKFDFTSLLSLRGSASGTSKFEYLEGTLNETVSISKILKNNGYDVKCYSDGYGTEESFITMHNNSPQILHIATHGFYYTPEETCENNFLRGSNDAMLLSGLVFSGGNAAWLGKELPEGVLGGILTASNISCMNLSNVDLAVLSSCQSGQGKITREGMFGLQRAFKKAGVQTMLLTLWNVSDVVTTEFMVEFYKDLFKRGYNKKRAFIKAKKKIRKKYPEPFYWAGFVMVD